MYSRLPGRPNSTHSPQRLPVPKLWMHYSKLTTLLLFTSCGVGVEDMPEAQLIEHAQGIHERVITLDTHCHLFGFSGGAQFAHRYVMAYPHRVASAVFAS